MRIVVSRLFSVFCLLLLFRPGYGQYLLFYYPSVGNMQIEFAPGMYNPDTFYVVPGPSFWYIQDYIDSLSIAGDISLFNVSQNDFGAFRYGGDKCWIAFHSASLRPFCFSGGQRYRD